MINPEFENQDIELLKQKAGCRPAVIPKDSKLIVYICRLMEQKTAGGIILTDKNVHDESYKKTKGLVIDIQHLTKDDTCNIAVGDIVCFRPYEGIHKVGEGDETYGFRLLSGYEIHSVLTK